MSDNPLVISSVSGCALPIVGAEVDTDRIVPARFLKEVTFDKMGDYLFYDVRHDQGQLNPQHPLNQPKYHGASIMVVENNFGCGSSREHAPQAIKRAGFNAIIGESFAEIFSGNCKALGIVTITLSRSELDAVLALSTDQPALLYSIDIESKTLYIKEVDQTFEFNMKRLIAALLDGTWDELALLKLNDDIIERRALRLPYFNW